MERRAKLAEIDLVRGMAILGAIMVHATSFATVDMLHSGLFGAYNFLNVFSKIGTTTFIFLSSFVLFYNYHRQPLTVERFKKFYRNRLMYIVVPYVLFSCFYFAVVWWQTVGTWDPSALFASFGNKLLTGQAYTHLYFVFISIQFYLLFPILLALFQRYKWMAASAVLIGVALQWAFFLYNREHLLVTNRGSWSPSYFGQYFLGAWLGMNFDKARAWLLIARSNVTRNKLIGWIVLWGAWLATGFGNVTIYYRDRLHLERYAAWQFDFLWDAYTMLTPLVLIQVAFLIGGKIENSNWAARLRHLGIVSFGVYLVHPTVLLLYRQYPPHTGNSYLHHLWYAGGYALAVLVSWIGVTLISRATSLSWLLFGNVPAMLKAASETRRPSEVPASQAPSAPSASA